MLIRVHGDHYFLLFLRGHAGQARCTWMSSEWFARSVHPRAAYAFRDLGLNERGLLA